MRSWPLIGRNVRPLQSGCSVGGWRQEISGGFVLESETTEGLLCGGQRKKEGESDGMEASQVCSFISTTGPPPPIPRPISKAQDGGMGARTTMLARTRLYPHVVVGVCPGIRYFNSPPRPFHPSSG